MGTDGAAYATLPAADAEGGYAFKVVPVTGNIYLWLAQGKRSNEGYGAEGLRGLYVFLVIVLQFLGPIAIAYYFASSLDYNSFMIDTNFASTENGRTAPGNPFPWWPNRVTKKLVSGIAFILFTNRLCKAMENKGLMIAKVRIVNADPQTYGASSPFLQALGNNILALAYLLTFVATWTTCLLAGDANSVFTSVTGLTLLSTLDEMGANATDLTPLLATHWDEDKWGQLYNDAMARESPGVDPNDINEGGKAFAAISAKRPSAMVAVRCFLRIAVWPMAVLFFCLDQRLIKAFEG